MKNEPTASNAGVAAPEETAVPPFFRELIRRGCLDAGEIRSTADGFCAAVKSLADILVCRGITTFPNDQNQQRDCDKFFDDWYCYAVPRNAGYVYSLFKLREQEFDAKNGLIADGDTPGVTVSFIAFDTDCLIRCLSEPTQANRKLLNQEINRVVAVRGQRHDGTLKAYFLDPKAEGAYLVAELYVRHIASFAREGYVAVPEHYAEIYRKSSAAGFSGWVSRIPRFLEENNASAGDTVCDHEKIYIRNPDNLTVYEKRAILATHTANVSIFSFAAEVRFHARFLTWYARLRVPFLGKSIYDSAIRADMTIDDTEYGGPAPFYRMNGRWVRQQEKYHRAYTGE